MEHLEYTIKYKEDGDYFIGVVMEIRGAIGWGKTLDEMLTDLNLAVKAINKSNAQLKKEGFLNSHVFEGSTEKQMVLC